MSKRANPNLDMFAAAAMAGMLAHRKRYRPSQDSSHPDDWHKAIAEEAYQLADAMMHERAEQRDGAWGEGL